MTDVQLLHEMAKGLAEIKGISEDKALQMIRNEYTSNSELHLKIPQQAQPYQPSQNTLFESTRDLLAKGGTRLEAAQAGSQASALEMRKLELEERRLEMEQKSLDAAQRREDIASQERKDALSVQQDRLAFDREQMRIEAKTKSDELKHERDIRRDEMKIDRETSRADQKFTQMLAMSQISGSGSEEIMKIIDNQNTTQKDYFKEINTVKDNERKHTDQLRTDLAKIESDRDVELAKLKASSDQNTATAIDTLVTKMDDSFQGLMKPNGDDGEDLLDKYSREIDRVNKFQTNLTAAGLNTLKSQGVDVEALKKAHNIATDSEESTLDKIIGVGKDLYEKTIKPGMEEAAKNGSGSGTDAPSGLETAFKSPDIEIESRIRAEQELQDHTLKEQIKLEDENAALKNELDQYQDTLYNKALQYGIPTHNLSIEELESMINQYESIMSTPFNSAPQTDSIIGLRRMASELNINTAGKTVGQVEAEVIQTQQKIDKQLDELPDYVPGQESEPESVSQLIESPPVLDQELSYEPDTTQEIVEEVIEPIPIEEPEQAPETPTSEETIDHSDEKPPGKKRSVTAQHTTDEKPSSKKQEMKTFTTSDGIVIEAKTPLSAATKLGKELKGTSDSPVIVELTDDAGKKFSYATRIDQMTRHGKIIDMPRAKKITT